MPIQFDEQPAAPRSRITFDSPAQAGPRVVRSLGDIVPGEVEGKDYVFDKPAGPRPQGQPTLPKLIGGLADNVLPAISSIPAEVAASATRLLGGGRERAENVRQSIQVQPFSQAGRDVQSELLGGAAAAVTPWMDAGSRAMDAAGVSPSVRGALGNTAQMVGDVANVLPVAAAARRLVPPMRGPNTPETVAAAGRATTPPEMANAAGMKIPASHEQARGGVPTRGARVRESLGAHEEHRTAVIGNRLRANEMARQDLGIPPGAQLDDQAFARAKEPHAPAYEEMRALPAAPIDAEFRSAVQRAGNSNVVLPASSEVARLKAYLVSQDTLSGEQLVSTISRLRERALRDSKMGATGDALDMADAQMALADSLEDLLQRRADQVDTSLAQRYRNARKGFAKINAVEMAMDGYNLDAQKLARYGQKNPGRLDGNLRAVAELARHYPDAVTARAPLAKDSDTLAGMVKAPFRSIAQRLVGGSGPTPNPAALEHLRRPDVPVTGGPVPPQLTQQGDGFGSLLDLEAPAGRVGELPPAPMPTQQVDGFGSLMDLAPPGPRIGELPMGPMPTRQGDFHGPMFDLQPVPGNVGAQPPTTFASLVNELDQPGFLDEQIDLPATLDIRAEPTSGLALDPITGQPMQWPPAPVPRQPVRRSGLDLAPAPAQAAPGSFEDLLAELGVQQSAGPAPFTGDYAPARGFSDLTRFNDFDDPPAAAMATPQPRPAGGAPGAAMKLYRGVPEGADPMAAGPAGGTYWAPDRPTAERYGSNVAEREANPADFMDVGTIEELRSMLGAPPEATVEELLQAFAQRSGRPRGVTYTLPPELEGVPREYFEFADLVE